MSKNEFRNIDVMFFVNLDWDSFSIIVDANETFLLVDFHFNNVHFLISLIIVCCVNKDLVKDFVESRDIGDLFIGKFEIVGPKNPFVRFFKFYAAYIGVWPYENVL